MGVAQESLTAGEGHAQPYFTHTKTRKLEGKARPGKRRGESREKKHGPLRTRHGAQKLGPAHPHPCRGSLPTTEARGRARAAPRRSGVGRSRAPSVSPPGQSHVSADSAWPRSASTASRALEAARAESRRSRAPSPAELRATDSPANRASLPPPVRPRPAAAARVFYALGMAEGGRVWGRE